MRSYMILAAGLAAGLSTAIAAGPSRADALQDLGQALFFDTNLSVNGTQSCASCHDPAAGFASASPAQVAGIMPGALGALGTRKPPTAAYAFAPVFHHVMEDGAPLFIGGLFHDGRATGAVTGDPLADQAEGPLLNPVEMALPSQACAVQRACETAGLERLDPQSCTALAGLKPCEGAVEVDVTGAFATMTRALAAYERSAEVSPFSSRYDQWRAGADSLTADELFGLTLFEGKAGCAACHVTTGDRPLFTDFTYDNLGLPPGTAGPDAGVQTTLAADPVYAPYAADMAGKFKVPTLRNVAKGQGRRYMHNGYFATLAGVMRFYNTRDLWPVCQTLLPEAEAMAQRCWPAIDTPATANHDELGNLGLTPAQEAQVVAFLNTLTDETPETR